MASSNCPDGLGKIFPLLIFSLASPSQRRDGEMKRAEVKNPQENPNRLKTSRFVDFHPHRKEVKKPLAIGTSFAIPFRQKENP